jgi:hypothetical protein
MSEKIKITLEVDDKGSVKNVEQLGNKLDAAKKAGEKAADGIELTTKAAKKGASAFKRLGSAIKGGFAVGAVVKGLDMLSQGLMSNQKTQDIFNRAIIVFQGLINGTVEVLEPFFKAIMKAFTSPKEAWDDLVSAFEAGGKWINDNIIDGVLNFFIIRINDLQIGFLKAKKAWNDLTLDFEESAEIQDKINKLTAENSKLTEENGKKVDNIVAVYEKAKNSVVKAANTIKKNTKEAFDNSGAILAAEKNLARLQIAFQGIVEQYDRQSELQRQIRDDETKTIDERIAANEKLAEVLEEGQKKELENLEKQIAQQQIRLSNNKGNIEIENEILALQAEKTAVEAKYTGLKSEQLTNINSLEKEGIELKRAEMEGTIEANAIISQSNADLLADTLEGFDARQKALDDEFAQRSELLNTELSQLKEGTQAYVDAVNEKKILEAQFTSDSKALAKELADYKKEQDQKVREQAVDSLNKVMDVSKAFLENSNTQLDKDYENRVENLKKLGYTEEQISKMRDGELQKIDERARKNFEIAKNINYAQTLLSTIQGTQSAFTTANKSPLTALFPAYPYIQAGLAAAFGAAQLQQIGQSDYMSKMTPSAGGGGGMGSASGPSVGIIQGQMSQTSQLQAELNSQMRRPTRAYVVGQNVTTQQSLDRHILENATL